MNLISDLQGIYILGIFANENKGSEERSLCLIIDSFFLFLLLEPRRLFVHDEEQATAGVVREGGRHQQEEGDRHAHPEARQGERRGLNI